MKIVVSFDEGSHDASLGQKWGNPYAKQCQTMPIMHMCKSSHICCTARGCGPLALHSHILQHNRGVEGQIEGVFTHWRVVCQRHLALSFARPCLNWQSFLPTTNKVSGTYHQRRSLLASRFGGQLHQRCLKRELILVHSCKQIRERIFPKMCAAQSKIGHAGGLNC